MTQGVLLVPRAHHSQAGLSLTPQPRQKPNARQLPQGSRGRSLPPLRLPQHTHCAGTGTSWQHPGARAGKLCCNCSYSLSKETQRETDVLRGEI